MGGSLWRDPISWNVVNSHGQTSYQYLRIVGDPPSSSQAATQTQRQIDLGQMRQHVSGILYQHDGGGGPGADLFVSKQ